MALSGLQSSWYPGGRAAQALELREEIVQACAGNPWAAEIPGYLHDMHQLLSGASGADATTVSGGNRPRGGAGARPTKSVSSSSAEDMEAGLLAPGKYGKVRTD